MSTIGKQTLSQAAGMIRALLVESQDKIDRAYCSQEDDVLSVSVSLKFAPDAEGTKIEAGISFVESRVKEKAVTVFDEQQLPLWNSDSVEVVCGGE